MLDNETLPATQSSLVADPSDFVQALFRQRWKFLLVVLFVFGLALSWTYGTPKRFTSEMVILVQNARGNEVVTSAQTGNTAAANDVTEEQLNSEVAVLNSNDILDEVVDPTWGKRSQESISQAELLAHETARREPDSKFACDHDQDGGDHASSREGQVSRTAGCIPA
jgi:uncharacterized protein involved in exopolysaccharide biosynthesis